MKNQCQKLLLLALLSSCTSSQEEETEKGCYKQCFLYGDIEHCYIKDENGIKLEISSGGELISDDYL